MSKELLEIAINFYKEGNSIKEICKILEKSHELKISFECVRKRLKRAGIILRSSKEGMTLRKRKHIDTKIILNAYQISKSVRKISRDFHINRLTIKKILLENKIKILSNDEATQNTSLKFKKAKFNGTEKDKAYLYGFVLGDVHAYKKSKFTLRAITHTTHKSFVELFTSEFEKYGHLMNKYLENKKEWRVMADLDYESFKFLEERKNNKIPDWINNDNFLEFISGFIDSDGTIMLRKCYKYFQYVIRLFGEDKEILKEITDKFKNMGFLPSFYKNAKKGDSRTWKNKIIKYNKDYYILEFGKKEEVIKLLHLLKLKHQEKIARKKLLIKIYNKNTSCWNSIKREVISLRKELESQSTLASN